MSRISVTDLRNAGISDEDIQTAKITQEAQRRTGGTVQSLAAIVGLVEPRKPNSTKPVSLTDRALRKRGAYDQAALLAQQQALNETTPERASMARDAAQTLKALSASSQIEFDFFGGGNMSIAHQYQDAITERLYKIAPTIAQADQAGMILWTICRHLGWQCYECTKTASQLCDITHKNKKNMSRLLHLLEQAGAIKRIKRGRVNVITVTPEGAYRGNINDHGKAVERYKLDVIDGGKADE